MRKWLLSLVVLAAGCAGPECPAPDGVWLVTLEGPEACGIRSSWVGEIPTCPGGAWERDPNYPDACAYRTTTWCFDGSWQNGWVLYDRVAGDWSGDWNYEGADGCYRYGQLTLSPR